MAKVTIKCMDCEAPREIGKALLKIVKRCKSCQTEYNRKQARDRYRKLKNIPLGKPVEEIKKTAKKIIKPTIVVEEKIEEPQQVVQQTPEDRLKRIKVIDHLLQIGIDQGLLVDLEESDWADDAKRY